MMPLPSSPKENTSVPPQTHLPPHPLAEGNLPTSPSVCRVTAPAVVTSWVCPTKFPGGKIRKVRVLLNRLQKSPSPTTTVGAENPPRTPVRAEGNIIETTPAVVSPSQQNGVDIQTVNNSRTAVVRAASWSASWVLCYYFIPKTRMSRRTFIIAFKPTTNRAASNRIAINVNKLELLRAAKDISVSTTEATVELGRRIVTPARNWDDETTHLILN